MIVFGPTVHTTGEVPMPKECRPKVNALDWRKTLGFGDQEPVTVEQVVERFRELAVNRLLVMGTDEDGYLQVTDAGTESYLAELIDARERALRDLGL